MANGGVHPKLVRTRVTSICMMRAGIRRFTLKDATSGLSGQSRCPNSAMRISRSFLKSWWRPASWPAAHKTDWYSTRFREAVRPVLWPAACKGVIGELIARRNTARWRGKDCSSIKFEFRSCARQSVEKHVQPRSGERSYGRPCDSYYEGGAFARLLNSNSAGCF